jgi:hypothetical protein
MVCPRQRKVLGHFLAARQEQFGAGMRGVFKGQPTFFTRHGEQLSKGSWHGCGAPGDSIAAGCDEIFSPASTHAPLAAWMRSKKTETVTGLRSRVSEGWKFKLTLPHRGRV